MDYSIGSVAALISGNITPNRPRSLKRALTPTKHQPSPNVTPKSEFVDDRSIFLSPSVQKKKAIIKKSPKRIFQAPDLDVTNDGEGIAVLSPKADKVKKHLKDDLEATTNSALNTKSPKSPKKKHNKSVEMKSPKKQLNLGNVETSDVVVASGDCTPTKSPKKKKLNKSMEIKSKKELSLRNNETSNVGEVDNVNSDKSPKKKKNILSVGSMSPKKQLSLGNDETSDIVMASADCTPNKKQKKNRNSISDVKESTDVKEKGNINKDKSPKKKLLVEGDNREKQDSLQIQVTSEGPKKNKKKRKKSKSKESISGTKNESPENATDKTDVSADAVINQSPQKANKKKNKRKTKKVQAQSKNTENEAVEIDQQKQPETKQKEEKKKSQVNPNAITDKDSDSEHGSDDEIESEDEHNTKILDTGPAESSDEEEEVSKPKKAKLDQDKEPSDVKTEDEVKRTIFVGNVPFSKKCKKDVKKIFSQHGEIETVRIRTIPVKDARVTPKLAIIKNELHPDRSTVNVYIRFKHPSSVEKALAENNTVLNEHHLRVNKSDSTGADHDPKCTVFVGNVPFAMEDEALRAKFENCGDIDSVRIVRDKKTNAGKGFGYVNFASKDGVELALAMSEEDLTVKNRILRVKRCTDTTKKDKHGGGQVHQRPHGRGGSVNRGGSFSRGGSSDRGNFSGRGGRGVRGGGSSDRGNFSGRGDRGVRGGGSSDRGNFSGRGVRGGGSSDRGNFSGRGARGGGNFNRGGSRGGGNFSRGGGNFGRGRGNFARGGGRGGRFQENRGGGGRFQGGNERNEGQMGFRGSEDPALRRIMNKRQNQDNSDGPPNKKARDTTQPKEKKARKEFVGMTAEKKKQKPKFDKGQKQKKALSEILTK